MRAQASDGQSTERLTVVQIVQDHSRSITPSENRIGIVERCSLLVDPATIFATVPIQTNAVGFGSLPLNIPPNQSGLGFTFYAQAVMIDPIGPFLGLSFTQRMCVQIGR